MDARLTAICNEKDLLLQRLAELNVEQQRLEGRFKTVPHYSALEQSAHELAQRLSRVTQARAARETAALGDATPACPKCGQACPATAVSRTITSLDGPVELLELTAHCPVCRRDFFPST